jgi:hypothetical protein
MIKRLTKFAQSVGTRLATSKIRQHAFPFVGLRRPPAAPLQLSPIALKVYRAALPKKLALIEHLPSKYRPQAMGVVWNAVMAGYDEIGLKRELHERFGIGVDRATLIARSQCYMARSLIENASRIESGITEALWQYEERFCAIVRHKVLTGRRYQLARGMRFENKWIWPGSDPKCFCSSGAVDASGAEDEG